jgi:pimeloyl-ACP methyl ester carboxylesterase
MTGTKEEGALLAPSEFDLDLPSARLHAERFGPADAPLTIYLPGLSANIKAADYLGERIAGEHLQLVALDLRGRGRSQVTPPGTYGWVNHAEDALAAADALGAERFSLVGLSLGAVIAMQTAALAAERIDRLILIDACGIPDPGTATWIMASANRLGQVLSSAPAYLQAVRDLGAIAPWNEYWDRYFEYELEEVQGGVRSRSSREAVLEDNQYTGAHIQDLYPLWTHLGMPVLLVRATREVVPGLGLIVTEADRDRFAREVPRARVVEVDANHYTINVDPALVSATAEFLAG